VTEDVPALVDRLIEAAELRARADCAFREQAERRVEAAKRALLDRIADHIRSLDVPEAATTFSAQRREIERLRDGLTAAMEFIAAEYSDARSAALDGDPLSYEARKVWEKMCAALDQGKDTDNG